MPELRLYVGDALAIAGAFVVTAAVLGAVRLPDPYARLHAASQAAVTTALAVVAAALPAAPADVVARAALVAAFLLLTAPVASHALARLVRVEEDPRDG